MKKISGLFIIVCVMIAGCVMYVPQGENGPAGPPPEGTPPPETPPPQQLPDDRWDSSGQDVSDYYSYLGPQGLWVSYAPYGNVWIPRGVDYLWRPYTLGHWVYSDYGWTWMSGERWGWLVYHYGRWGWDVRLGWFWVPGTVWGPSWVAWRWGDTYIGWAPLPPGDDFDMRYGFRRRTFDIPGQHWNFVRGRDFMNGSLGRLVLPPERNVTIINTTHIDVNIHVKENHVINDGVGVDHVRRLTNQAVVRHQLKDARRPDEARVDARDVVLFRPDIRKSEAARPKEVLDKDQAAARIGRQQARQTPQMTRNAPRVEEATLRQRHDQELKRLEQDQRNEVTEIRRKADAAKGSARNAVEKQKIDADAKAKIAATQKRQAADKAKLAERHKQEADNLKKSPPKKKEAVEKY
ncbi:MAG: DUF6600 domain-containing protein [Candidatus Aminicenantales bacterium]